MLGQYEDSYYDVIFNLEPEYYDFYNPDVGDVGYLYYEPSTGQYEFYNPPGADVSGALYSGTAQTGSSILDIIKNVLGIATPVITSVLTAEQRQAATAAQLVAAKTPTSILPASLIPTSITSMLSGITSNLPLLAAVVVGGYFLLRRKGTPSGRGKISKKRRR